MATAPLKTVGPRARARARAATRPASTVTPPSSTAWGVPVHPAEASKGPPLTSTGLAELSRAGVVPSRATERWLCEGTVQPVYVGPGADQLQTGRKVRVANRAQRRALRVRDGGCVFPGCSVAAEHCVAHHVVWWEVGGRTDLANLVLVCRFHHKAVHDRGFRMTRTDGHVHVSRPDGSPISGPLRARPGALDRRGPAPASRDPIDHPDPGEVAQARALRRRVDEPHRMERAREAMSGPAWPTPRRPRSGGPLRRLTAAAFP